jgi:glycosyltransferase involved in cell wall biosynthesis
MPPVRTVPVPGRPRILAVTTDLRITGAKRVLVDGAVGIDRARFDPHVLLLSPVPPDDPLRRELEEAGVPVHHVPVRSRLHLRGVRALARWLDETARPDLVHTHCSRSAGVMRLVYGGRGERPRILVHFHGTVTQRAMRWRHRVLDQFLRPYTDLVLAPTHHAAARGARRHAYRGLPTRVLPNGVDLGKFLHPRRTRDEVRARWGVAPNERVVLLLGRWGWTKGHDVLIDAIPEILRHAEPVRFVFVAPEGGGEYRDQMERRLGETDLRGRVVLAGRDTDPAGCYLAADVVTMPSRDEPFGLVAVESMACGRTLVAARVPGLAEVAGDDGGVVWVRPGDPRDLARGVRVALDEAPVAREARAEMHRVRARRFALPLYLDGIEEAYASLLRRPDLAAPVRRLPPAADPALDRTLRTPRSMGIGAAVPVVGGWRA